MIGCELLNKVEVPIVDHLSDFQADHEQYEEVIFLPCRKIGNMGTANFSEFYFQN